MLYFEMARAAAKKAERNGDKVDISQPGVATAFQKNPPAAGIAYSKNFARLQKDGIFAVQIKD